MKNKEENINPADLEIDKYALDDEWAKQPVLYHHWATKLADARLEYDEAKHNVEVVEAEMEMDVRRLPSRYGIEKVTESVVAKAVVLTKEYREAVATMHQAKHRVARLEADVSSLDHRKKGLEKHVDLFLSDYWSTPRVKTPEAREQVERADRERTFAPSGRRRGED